jgi:hypothetical protein
MKTEFTKKDIEKIIALIGQIRPILFGNPSAIQGAVLAELTAIWLAGHYADNPKDTAEVRARLLATQTTTIVQLAAIKDAVKKTEH